MKHSNRR